MKILESITSAFKSLYAYKMRSLLTMLGIIIGISSVIMITGFGDGVYNAIYDELDPFNTTSIQVMPRNLFGGPLILTFDDKAALLQLPNVDNVTGMLELLNQTLYLRIPGETLRGSGWGLDHYYHTLERVDMLYGRFISETDVATGAFVTVISREISLDVFGMVNSVGHTLEVRNNRGRFILTVVGIMDIEPYAIGTQTPLNMANFIVPLSTAGFMRNQINLMDNISVSIEDPTQSLNTAAMIARLLNFRHDMDDGFLVVSVTTVLDGLDTIFAGVLGFIAFVAGISLFVGGVGVMNIMMVTVTERTREIGIKKSLGATSNLIRLQFIAEAVALALTGGILGIIFGLFGAGVLADIATNLSDMSISANVDPVAIVIAVVVSTAVGLIFGVYPADKAAKLDPVESLRYE